MIEIEFTRKDLYPWCKKISIRLIKLREHIDLPRLKRSGEIGNHDVYRSDKVVFVDNDGKIKILKGE